MFSNFQGILIVGVPIYSALLSTMGWRANARLQNMKNLPKLVCGIGAVLFVISDSLIAFNMFYAPIPHSKLYVMVTYYLAQLGIALSTLDHDVGPKTAIKSN